VAARVLVIEDNAVNLELVVVLLEEAGCEVLTAKSADAGLRLAAAERPDLILMDLHLPGMTGYEATGRLKADPATAAIPVVALTADAMRGSEARAEAAGCDAYLTKPLDIEALHETLRRLLPSRQQGARGGEEPRG
jgi:two-component system cell cycle response regulator DivK